jgi:hypothetical protein
MEITITYERPEEGPQSGPVTVGWFRDTDKGGVIYDPPERLVFRQTNKAHAKSASRCPAVIQMESRYFFIRCPFDIHVGFARDDKGQPGLINRAGIASPIRGSKLGEKLRLVSEAEWRYPDRPTIQMQLPYVFIADEPVYVTQLGAFAHYRPDPLPGTIFGGRFPINLWPRPLMWAFEWHEPQKDIILKRGEPLFYCHFEGDHPERPISVVEAEKTPELLAFVDHLSGAVNYVNQTFSLFHAAAEARPKVLLTPKKRG